MKFKKIYLEITNKCNLNCDFCIKNKREEQFISIDKFITILDKIKLYTSYLYFHVLGEPLLHPKINELIDLAHSKNFSINITTNGYLIKRVKDNKNIRQINISLHSYDERYKMPLDEYLNSIFKSVDTLVKNNTFISYRLWVNSIYNKQIIKYINDYYQISIDKDIKNYKINDHIFINNFHEFIWPDLNNNIYDEVGECYGLKDHIGILVNGTVIPCCLDTKGIINLGNIFNSNLDEIINSNRFQGMLNGFREHKKCEELCKHCRFLDTK